MSRESSSVAAIAVVLIAGVFLLLLVGGAALMAFGWFALRSVGPPAAAIAPPPAMTVSSAPPRAVPQLDATTNAIPLVIEADGVIKVDGQVQSEQQLREYLGRYKTADTFPVVFAHQNAPPDRLERLQELCQEIVGTMAEVHLVTTADAPNENEPAAAPAP